LRMYFVQLHILLPKHPKPPFKLIKDAVKVGEFIFILLS